MSFVNPDYFQSRFGHAAAPERMPRIPLNQTTPSQGQLPNTNPSATTALRTATGPSGTTIPTGMNPWGGAKPTGQSAATENGTWPQALGAPQTASSPAPTLQASTSSDASGGQPGPYSTPPIINPSNPIINPLPPQVNPVLGSVPTPGAGANTQVQTTVQPQPVFTPNQTQHAVNQAMATNAPDWRSNLKTFDRPGTSRSASSYAAAAPEVAKQRMTGQQAAATIPLEDEIANQQSMLAGQTSREQQGLQLAELMSRLQGLYDRDRQLQQSQGTGLFNSLLGGLMGTAGGMFGGI